MCNYELIEIYCYLQAVFIINIFQVICIYINKLIGTKNKNYNLIFTVLNIYKTLNIININVTI